MTVKEALQLILDNRHEKSLNYAINIAKHGLSIENDDELRVQCFYVLNNITRWRGETASAVRNRLRRFTYQRVMGDKSHGNKFFHNQE